MEGKIILLGCDNYLFTKKTLEQRLAGDNDTLLGWLRTLEVAMKACERNQDREAKNAAKFFEQCRALGRQKLLVNRIITETQLPEEIDAISGGEVNSYSLVLNYGDRETTQLESDVSQKSNISTEQEAGKKG